MYRRMKLFAVVSIVSVICIGCQTTNSIEFINNTNSQVTFLYNYKDVFNGFSATVLANSNSKSSFSSVESGAGVDITVTVNSSSIIVPAANVQNGCSVTWDGTSFTVGEQDRNVLGAVFSLPFSAE
jgi:hypothetical protein